MMTFSFLTPELFCREITSNYKLDVDWCSVEDKREFLNFEKCDKILKHNSRQCIVGQGWK